MTSNVLKNFLAIVFFVCFHFVLTFLSNKVLPWNQFIDVLSIYFYVILFIASVALSDYVVDQVKKEKRF